MKNIIKRSLVLLLSSTLFVATGCEFTKLSDSVSETKSEETSNKNDDTTSENSSLEIESISNSEDPAYESSSSQDVSEISDSQEVSGSSSETDAGNFTSAELALIPQYFDGEIPYIENIEYEVSEEEDLYGEYLYICFTVNEDSYNSYLSIIQEVYDLEYDANYEGYFYDYETSSLELYLFEEEGSYYIELYLYQVEPLVFLDQTAFTTTDKETIATYFTETVPFVRCYDYAVSEESDDDGDYCSIYFDTSTELAQKYLEDLDELLELTYDEDYDYYLYESETECLELAMDVYDDETLIYIFVYKLDDEGEESTEVVINVNTLGDSISLGGYSTFEKTIGGITFQCTNLMVNPTTNNVNYSDFVQMKKSSKGGEITNKTAFTNLTTITATFITNPSSGNLNTFTINGGTSLVNLNVEASETNRTNTTVAGQSGVVVTYTFASAVSYVKLASSGACSFYSIVFGGSGNDDGGEIVLVDDGNGYSNIDFTKGEVRNVTELGDYLDGCPTTGDLNVLVIPVDFSDCTAASKGYTVEALEKAFNGDEDNTFLYYSVAKYFNLTSYGQLNINFDVVDQFIRAKYASTEYEKAYNGRTNSLAEYYDYYGYSSEDEDGTYATAEMVILDECLQYLDKTLNYDLSKYDSDNNETIDAVILVYTQDIDEEDANFFWAFRYWNMLGNPDELYDPEDPDMGYDWFRYDGVYANDYLWASYQFLFESADGNSFDSYSTTNTYTFIHEFSHVLGAEDYYDYSGETEPMDTYDMMDMRCGDHNLFTKAYLGWIENARIITTEDTVTLNLKAMEEEGDIIILANSFDESKGLFQEYYIIQYYTNTGLFTKNGELFDENGIVVYHVNASVTYDSEYEAYYMDYTNTSYTEDTDYGTEENLIEIVKNGSSYVFGVGDSLQTVKFDNGSTLGFTFTVDALTADEATITFTRK